MAMKLAKLCFMLTALGFVAQSSHCEPNYQPQQPPGGNDFSGAGGGANAIYAGNQQLQQQQQQPRPYPPSLGRFRPAPSATTPAPTFFQRISSWFSFLGDDSGERRPQQPLQQQQQPQPQQQYPQVPQLPPQQRLPPAGPPQYNAPGIVHPTPSVQTQQQLQYQQQQQQQQYQHQQLQFQQQQQQQNFQQQQFQQQQPAQPVVQQQPFPYPFQIRNGSRATQLTPVHVQHVPQQGFQPSAPILESGSSYHAAVAPHVPPFGPSTLQQQIVPPATAFRDPEPTTSRAPTGAGPGDVKYHPCNNVPWVPIAAPPEYPAVPSPGGTVGVAPHPPKVAPSGPSPPIKLQVAPKGHVQSVSPYTGASAPAAGPEPAIITAAPHAQQLIQLQLQQQQHQLQNLQLQQLQIQQQQLQQQLQQLKTTTPGTPLVHTGAPPIAAHFITKAPGDGGPSTTLQPITLRQVSASYFTNKEYAPPAKLLPIQDEGKPLAPIPLPNLSATPIPPLYTAGSFHSDPYKFYRPYRPVEPILELGHGYPVSSKSMSDSYTRYPHDPSKQNNSVFEVEQFASSASSSVYTTVAYSNGGEDSKPAASEKRNVATSSNGSSGANLRPSNHLVGDEDTEYDSEEDTERTPPRTRTTIEVSSIVPQTRYYGSTTTSTMRPPSTVRYSTFQDQTTPHTASPPPPPLPSTSDLGNGVQIIYSANLQTNPPIDPVNNGLAEDDDAERETTQVTERQRTLGPPTITASTSTTPATVFTETDASTTTGIYTEPFRIGSSLPAQFQRQSTPEPASQTVDETSPPSVVTTVTPLPSSLTATFGGYQNLQQQVTKKPKQIQIIIPYQTYKKPEPFRPLPDSIHLDDLDYNAPEESSIVTSKHTTTPSSANAIGHAEPAKHGTRFIENDSVKYFQSTAHLRDILQRETTQPFSKPATRTPAKPAKVKKVRPVEISKESKPFTVRVPKMTPLPPVVSLSSLTSVRGGMERHTTPLPTDLPPGGRGSQSAEHYGGARPAGPLVALSKYAKPVTPHYVNVTRIRVAPTTYAQKSRTTISQLLRTTKIIPKGPKLFGNDLRVPESTGRTTRPALSPASTTYAHHRRTTLLSSSSHAATSTTPHTTSTTPTTTSTTTTEEPEVAEESTVEPIFERNDWEIDPNELQRKIDTWTEQEFGSDDFARKSSTLSLHRVTKAIPWEFLTSTMLPSLHDRPGARSGWHNVKIAISPITKEKIYVVTPQPWTAALLNHHHNHHHHHHHQDHDDTRILTPRFSVRPTPLYYKGGGIFQTGPSTVDVSPESVNDLLEQKPKHRFSSLGGGANLSGTSGTKVKHLLQQRKYVRKKLPYATGRPGASREDV